MTEKIHACAINTHMFVTARQAHQIQENSMVSQVYQIDSNSAFALQN